MICEDCGRECTCHVCAPCTFCTEHQECELCGRITCKFEEVQDKTDGNTIIICQNCLDEED